MRKYLTQISYAGIVTRKWVAMIIVMCAFCLAGWCFITKPLDLNVCISLITKVTVALLKI